MQIPTLFRAALIGLLLTPCALFADTTSGSPDVLQLRYVTVAVKSYDEALAWYTGVLGLKKLEDRDFGHGHRWLVVAPESQQAPGIVLDLASPDIMDAPAPAKGDRIGKERNWPPADSPGPRGVQWSARLLCEQHSWQRLALEDTEYQPAGVAIEMDRCGTNAHDAGDRLPPREMRHQI